MKKIYKKHIIFLVSLILFFVLIVLSFLFFLNSVRVKIKKTNEINSTLAGIERDKSKYLVESEKFQSLKSRLENLKKEIPSQSTISLVLSSMEARAMLQNLTFEIEGVTVNTKDQVINISFNASGTIENIQNYLDTLYQQNYPITIKSFSLSSSAPEGEIKMVQNEWILIATISIPKIEE